jgi:hypothetical protein
MATAGATTAGMAAAGTTDEHTRYEQRIIPHRAKAPITLCPYRGFRASQGGRSDGKPGGSRRPRQWCTRSNGDSGQVTAKLGDTGVVVQGCQHGVQDAQPVVCSG